MILIQQCSDIQMGLNTWAQFRRTISFVRGQTESLRHTYLSLNPGMSDTPGSDGAMTSESQDATNPLVLPPPGNIYRNSPNIIQVLDEALSELRTLETKYMPDRDPPNIGSAALNIPFWLRLTFRVRGKRNLKGILAELERRNDDLKAMIKELREIAQWNLETSARQMSNVAHNPAATHTTLPEVEPGSSVPYTANSSPDNPPMDAILPPAHGTTPPEAGPGVSMPCIQNSNADTAPTGVTLPPAHASMLPRAGDTNAVDNPPYAAPSFAGSGYRTNMSGEFHSADSFSSYERQDNYSTHTGDKICIQCHQVWRRDSNP